MSRTVFFLKLNIPPAVVWKLELLNVAVGMVSEVRQLLLSMRKLNLYDTCLLSSRKLACVVLKHRMEMLVFIKQIHFMSLHICVIVCKSFRQYCIWQILPTWNDTFI